jgi:hypothetical protein
MAWVVETWSLCGGWENTWTVDDEPQVFATQAEAQAELDEYLNDPELRDSLDADEFRIVEVSNPINGPLP